MRDFSWIYEHALNQKGSMSQLEALLPQPKTAKQLASLGEDRYLSEMSRRIFRAGLKYSMVDGKWPAFEDVFHGFEPEKVILMSDEALENTLQDKRIIRHWGKVKSIRINAAMITDLAAEYGSFGQFLAGWPGDNIIGLWQLLARRGHQLGGNSAAYFLRMVGKDTFLLTKDVVGALVAQGVVDRKVTSKAELQAVQLAFNRWHKQSGRPLCQISRLLSFCVD